jgi:hypothetical protein
MGIAQSLCPHCVGCELKNSSRVDVQTVREYVIRLNVYEIKSLPVYSRFAAALGSGLYHSGLEISQVLPNGEFVDGYEYCFGGNSGEERADENETGVWVCMPRRAKANVKSDDEQLSWLTTLELGTSVSSHNFRHFIHPFHPLFPFRSLNRCHPVDSAQKMSAASMMHLLDGMKHDWPACSYHVIERNCNHFADALCMTLVGRGIPLWVNEIASATNVSRSLLYLPLLCLNSYTLSCTFPAHEPKARHLTS